MKPKKATTPAAMMPVPYSLPMTMAAWAALAFDALADAALPEAVPEALPAAVVEADAPPAPPVPLAVALALAEEEVDAAAVKFWMLRVPHLALILLVQPSCPS